jgi:hypothetical protein
MAAAGSADRRSAKNAARPLNQPRELHLAAWPHHSPKHRSWARHADGTEPRSLSCFLARVERRR